MHRADYARIISEFDCKSYKISDFEIIAQSNDIVQVHYIIETVAEKPENQDLAGRFYTNHLHMEKGGQMEAYFQHGFKDI